MNKKPVYFSNISQHVNLTGERKSISSENVSKVSSDTSSNSWFASLKNNSKKSRPGNDKVNERRQNSWTSSEGANSLISNNNSLISKEDANLNANSEKADTVSNLSKFDARTGEQSSSNQLNSEKCSSVALRDSTKSNKSSNRTIQTKEEFSRQTKDESESYHRYSTPDPFIDQIPKQFVIEHYLQYVHQHNLALSVDQLNYLNYLTQLNQLNQLNRLNELNRASQQNQLNKLQNQSNLQSQVPNQAHQTTSFSLVTANQPPVAQASSILHLTTNSEPIDTKSSTIVNAKPCQSNRQLARWPQLVVDESSNVQLDEQCKEQPNKHLDKHSTNLTKQTSDSTNLDCDELSECVQAFSLTDTAISQANESDSRKDEFRLVKELFDAEAHLYMTVEEMSAMETLIRNNPRTCRIVLSSKREELGFNLITKKRPSLAHIVKKVNPHLKSAKAGLQENDQLLMVNQVDCRNLTHQQVVRLLENRDEQIKLVVCQPLVYEWYLKQGYELKLDYDDENNQAMISQSTENVRRKQTNELDQAKKYRSQPQLNQLRYNERCVDDVRPIHRDDQMLAYADTIASDVHKDNLIRSDQFNSRNLFKRSYSTKSAKKKPAMPIADDVVDETLSMSTSVSPYDEQYNELRDEIFSGNRSNRPVVSNKSQTNTLPNTTKSLLDKYNYKKENIELKEYMDSSLHKLEKSETTVLESNDEFQNKKVTRKSVERIHKNFDDQPMKNILNKPLTTPFSPISSKTTTTTASKTDGPTSEKITKPYKPVYGKTSLFSNSLFDKSKTTSIFDTKPSSFDKTTSIFDRPYSDKLTTTAKSNYASPNYSSSLYNQQSYSSQKNESSSYSKSYTLSPTIKYNPSSYDDRQTLIKDPFIERHVIEPKEAQLVHIDDPEPVVYKKPAKQAKEERPQFETKPMKTVQANTSNDLPSPRLCTLKLPKDRICSFGFTIKTSRKTNAKIITEIKRNSIAHRAGLRVNDIIVEVNDKFVGQDTHQQVTDSMKASGEEMRLLVVTEAEMDIYRNYGLVPSSDQSNVILVEYDSELVMPLHPNDYEDTDCLKGCGGFLDNLTAKQYRTYLNGSKKRPEPANSPQEFQEKIQKFEKL